MEERRDKSHTTTAVTKALARMRQPIGDAPINNMGVAVGDSGYSFFDRLTKSAAVRLCLIVHGHFKSTMAGVLVLARSVPAIALWDFGRFCPPRKRSFPANEAGRLAETSLRPRPRVASNWWALQGLNL